MVEGQYRPESFTASPANIFAGRDVTAIALQVPDAALGGARIAAWPGSAWPGMPRSSRSAEGVTTLLVVTAAADIGNLRFYQRQGFRMQSIVRDAFTPATGYPPGLHIDGIKLRDRVWFDLQLGSASSGANSP